MSPFVPLTVASVAALLLYGRARRLAARPPRSYWGDRRPRALAEAAASALTVLIVGWVLAAATASTPHYTQPVFTTLALGVGVTQFIKSMRARRALITVRR